MGSCGYVLSCLPHLPGSIAAYPMLKALERGSQGPRYVLIQGDVVS
jgi:hypothetical protein